MALRRELFEMFQGGPLECWYDIPVRLGDAFHDLDGGVIIRGDAYSNRDRRLPAALDGAGVVTGDLIPSTSWGANLCNLLTKSSWDALRHPLIADRHKVCELCGQRFDSLDVHEAWSYDFPPEEEQSVTDKLVFGIQRFEYLMAVCHECHLCFHLGKAKTDGVLDRTLDRLGLLNRWSPETTAQYIKVVMERFESASRFHWMLDFSNLEHPGGGLVIKSPWKPDEEDGRFIAMDNPFGGITITAILGTPWKFVREPEWRPLLTAETL